MTNVDTDTSTNWESIKDNLTKIALDNAYAHNGKTSVKIILGKILGSRPELRQSITEIAKIANDVISDVNSKSIEEQKIQAQKLTPQESYTHKAKKEDTKATLPDLEGATYGNVITRFPPEPNGYPHIGHAKAAIINHTYAKRYGGKCILRIDDTNPETERMEYHAAIKVGLEWLGIEFDTIKNTSDDMDLFYQKGQELVDSAKAYVCTCKRDKISKNRMEKKACKCTTKDLQEHVKRWMKMSEKFKPGEAILRFRGDMKSNNAVMRDPVLFRIIDEKHYILGKKYRVWPSYDFAVAIEDSIDGITHAFRSKEFEMRTELTEAILDALNMRKPHQGFFSRLEFDGMPTSKRVIKPLIDTGKVSWYDDPRLPTLEGLKRRGVTPAAIRKFIVSLGMTKAETLAPFDALEAFNRSEIDAYSTRLFMVSNPKKMSITGLNIKEIKMPNHPVFTTKMGERIIGTGAGQVYIPGEDASKIHEGMLIRLLGLAYVKVTKVDAMEISAEFVRNAEEGIWSASEILQYYKKESLKLDPDQEKALVIEAKGKTKNITTPRMQWVPQDSAHNIRLIIPKPLFAKDEIFNEDSLVETDVYTEPYFTKIKDGRHIQFVRFGYCRKDTNTQAIFTHK